VPVLWTPSRYSCGLSKQVPHPTTLSHTPTAALSRCDNMLKIDLVVSIFNNYFYYCQASCLTCCRVTKGPSPALTSHRTLADSPLGPGMELSRFGISTRMNVSRPWSTGVTSWRSPSVPTAEKCARLARMASSISGMWRRACSSLPLKAEEISMEAARRTTLPPHRPRLAPSTSHR
jgi:hypothetical protein